MSSQPDPSRRSQPRAAVPTTLRWIGAGAPQNDPFFLPGGAEAFRRDIPDAIIHFFDTGHFALETHAKEIAAAIRDFFAG